MTSLDSKETKKVAAALGKVQTISAANRAIGAFLGELVPNEGHSVGVDLGLMVFVQGLMIGMDHGCRVERTQHGVELSGNMGLAFGVGELGRKLSAEIVIPTGKRAVSDIYQASQGVYDKGMKQASNKVGGASGRCSARPPPMGLVRPRSGASKPVASS